MICRRDAAAPTSRTDPISFRTQPSVALEIRATAKALGISVAELMNRVWVGRGGAMSFGGMHMP
jgi:hypothetical protein